MITIVLAAYNAKTKGYIKQTIQSILAQTYPYFELLIIDDGSADDTGAFIQENFNDQRIHYIYQENQGVSKARNHGISLAQGELICIVDDDDLWDSAKLAEQVQLFVDKSNIAMLYCAINRIDEEGNFLNYQYHEAGSDFYSQMLLGNMVDATSGVMIRRSVLEKVGGFANIAQGAEDYELWVRIAKEHEVASLAKPLVFYRVHSKNDSKNIEKNKNGILQALQLIAKNDPNIDEKTLILRALSNLANKSFELGNYRVFRDLIFEMKGYGRGLSAKLWIKYWLGFCPVCINFLRKFK